MNITKVTALEVDLTSTVEGTVASAKKFAAENPKGFFVVTERGNIKSTFHIERGQTDEAIQHWVSLPFSGRKKFTANT